MGYANLAQCVQDLEATGHLIRLDPEIDPYLEAGAVQRRVFQANGPALLFTQVKGSSFPMLGNLFGTRQRLEFIFRDTLAAIQGLFQIKADPWFLFKNLGLVPKLPKALWTVRPRRVARGSIQLTTARLSDLPQLVSWPQDGGAYITLPQVYSESPDRPGIRSSNLGMYRIQISGKDFDPQREAGLHYQIHRGIGSHHSQALARNEPLPVNVFVGGPPAMTLAAVMPLPEGIPELYLAGALTGKRIPLVTGPNGLPVPAEADFCICGQVFPHDLRPEGPFGDHLGYYSLAHDFPVLRVERVWHRPGAIWPFTTVGRPPQEDSIIGSFIHDLVAPLVPSVFPGLHEVHAVDQAGVHPLLLAVGSERYVPFTRDRMPQELLTNAHALLGNTQTALSKYIIIAAREDDSRLTAHNIPDFFHHFLLRVDWTRDLHFITRTTMDTLDYSGISLNQGSKAILAAAGSPKRELAQQLPEIALPSEFKAPALFASGIMLLQGPRHEQPRDSQDPVMHALAQDLTGQAGLESVPLLVVVDDSSFATATWDNFLWVTFTRSDPATDTYGLGAFTHAKHWGCNNTLIIDARLKTYHAPPLEPDPEVEKRVDALGAPGQPLHGII
ncbi:MAG: UbiD family decarboxylase [Desulfovermiculus sp.]|nr:UbiD family decarboxylase [Desulfovermiculus sp.]